jgi:hypothetical protein
MTLIKIEPSYKKSVYEIEFFKHEESGIQIEYEQGWRWGTFYADVTDDEMEELKAHNKHCEENNSWEAFEISALTDFELNDTWDGVWGDIRVWKTDWTDEQRAELKETIEDSDDWWDWLMDKGYEPFDTETFISGVIDIELIDKLPWDDS